MENYSNTTSQNPFNLEKLPNVDRDASYKLMFELNKLHDKLTEQFKTEPRESFSCHPHEDPNRKLEYKDYGRDGSKEIRDVRKSPDGSETLFSYHIDSSKSGSPLRGCSIVYRNTSSGQTSEFISEFILNPGEFLTRAFESFDRHEVNDFGEDGLHVETRERVEWSMAWQKFFSSLAEDQTFLDALERSKFLKTHGLQIEYNPLKIDLNAVLNDLENIWNAAYSSKLFKKKFPRDKAPTSLGPPPPKWIISYKEIQRLLQYVINKLAEDVRLLDQYQFPDKPHPYR
jgi:hypothetical protein